MSVYANIAAFEAYAGPTWTTTNAAALQHAIDQAERDLEGLYEHIPLVPTGTFAGHRWDTTSWATWERGALERAVCAQAEYSIEIGAGASAGTDAQRVSGPDFSVEHAKGSDGARRRYGPKVATELAPLRLRFPTGARARA